MTISASWRSSRQGFTYARSITASTVAARQPVGFEIGEGTVRVTNSSATVYIAFMAYSFAVAGADPTLTFPVDGSPPVGQSVTIIGPGQTAFFDIPANADSFAAIGSAAGPSVIYVQRGAGVGP